MSDHQDICGIVTPLNEQIGAVRLTLMDWGMVCGILAFYRDSVRPESPSTEAIDRWISAIRNQVIAA